MFGNITYESDNEKQSLKEFTQIFRDCPIPDDEILQNLGLFLSSKVLSRILFMDFIYKKIIDTEGIVIDFGTRWGQTASLFSALRGIYEPFNRKRKILAFDTFKGFLSISPQDGKSVLMKAGIDGVTKDYIDYLDGVLTYQENLNPLSHIKKFEVIAGDASKELKTYLKNNPETIISLAYFDFDLYEPTKKCLKMIQSYLTKGSVVAFDELNDHDSPGETTALKEIMGLNNVKLERHRYTSRTSYFVMT